MGTEVIDALFSTADRRALFPKNEWKNDKPADAMRYRKVHTFLTHPGIDQLNPSDLSVWGQLLTFYLNTIAHPFYEDRGVWNIISRAYSHDAQYKTRPGPIHLIKSLSFSDLQTEEAFDVSLGQMQKKELITPVIAGHFDRALEPGRLLRDIQEQPPRIDFERPDDEAVLDEMLSVSDPWLSDPANMVHAVNYMVDRCRQYDIPMTSLAARLREYPSATSHLDTGQPRRVSLLREI